MAKALQQTTRIVCRYFLDFLPSPGLPVQAISPEIAPVAANAYPLLIYTYLISSNKAITELIDW